ncbi:MAG TPA: IS66 family transposase [Gemmataceae bacterium]|nr:IS66 family transposase [Gemmataceae bacterium]
MRARLGQNASNSSLPPSANPPQAAKPVVKKPTGRKPGGQPGHAPAQRLRLPPERVDEVVRHVPTVCQSCHEALPAEAGPGDPEPTWHQVAELPPIAARVTEHQGHSRICPHCGTRNHAPIPADIRAHVLGPRLAAVMAYLSGARHDSKRGVEDVVETVFGVSLALGTVAAVEQEVSSALAPAHAEALAAVRQAPAKNADETGWKQAGRRCWLWTAVTAGVACFLIHARRGAVGLAALLGDSITGIVTSDRWSAYHRLALYRRQLCWAHLRRDFQALVDAGGPGKAVGNELLCLADDVFTWWHRVRDGTLRRATLRAYVNSQRPWLRDLLERGAGCGSAKAAALCGNLRELEPALWTFTRVEGVEPTNNAAERALRPAVLWRRRSFGCHSAAGCRFVERMLTAVQTLRLQERPALDYLVDAITAHRQGFPAPKLLPAD